MNNNFFSFEEAADTVQPTLPVYGEAYLRDYEGDIIIYFLLLSGRRTVNVVWEIIEKFILILAEQTKSS